MDRRDQLLRDIVAQLDITEEERDLLKDLARDPSVHEPGRRGRTVALIVLFLATVVGFFVVQGHAKHDSDQAAYKVNVEQTQASQQGCQRTNDGLRRPFYEVVTAAARNRRILARESTGFEHDANIAAATEYKDIRRLVVQAAEDVARRPGSPEVDCIEAYPLPDAP